MLECDVAINNSGLTKYELPTLGITSLIISNNKHQSLYNDIFQAMDLLGSDLDNDSVALGVSSTVFESNDKRARIIKRKYFKI